MLYCRFGMGNSACAMTSAAARARVAGFRCSRNLSLLDQYRSDRYAGDAGRTAGRLKAEYDYTLRNASF